MTGLARILDAFAAAIEPEEMLTVSQWADKYRRLPAKGSAEPGQWSTDRVPHQREILDTLGDDHPATEVVVMLASQVGGKTECILNRIGYTIHRSPAPILVVQPTETAVDRFSKQRVAPMIAETPVLRDRVMGAKGRDSGNTIELKEFHGGILIISGANSPSDLASVPIRIVLLDEVDRFETSAGTEGNPAELAIKRTTTYGNRKKIGWFSTPTIEGASQIWKKWEISDQRRRLVPCPHCGTEQELEWERLRWTPGEADSAWYECERGCVIDESAKLAMLPAGRWEPTRPESRIPGFRLSALHAPLGWDSWATLVREYEAALQSGDPEDLKVFWNTRLCRVFDPDAEIAPPENWEERAEVFEAPCPAGVQVVTAGVDVQDDRLEIEVVGWGRGEESWSLAYAVIPGDPSSPALWEDLDATLRRGFARVDGRVAPIASACIDSGGHHTERVYAFAAQRAHRRVWAIFGRPGPRPIWPKRASKVGGGRYRAFVAGVDAAKDRVVPRLRIEEPGAGYCHVPAGRGPVWYAQMRSEVKRVLLVQGRSVVRWVQTAKRNEALDCRVYAYAALHSLIAAGYRLDDQAPVPQTEAALPVRPVAQRPADRPDRQPSRPVGGYMDRFRR